MELKYRGIAYQPKTSKVDSVEGEVGGSYRGAHWKIHPHRHQARHNGHHNLTYRSIPYEH